MGIDWLRMRPQANADAQTLARLVELQAEGFRDGYPDAWKIGGEVAAVSDERRLDRQRQYQEASQQLRALLEFPPHDPDLDLGRRNYAIARNRIFPPCWQVAANRTFLPQALADQLVVWKTWLAEVAAGKHQTYLLQQYLYETTTDLDAYSRELKEAAQTSLTVTAAWAGKPDLVALREQIFAYQAPPIHPAPNFPWPERRNAEVPLDHSPLLAIQQKLDELVGLTRNWDRRVKGSRKLGYYQNYYCTFAEYVDQATSPDLQEELDWLTACSDRAMGVFLDY